MIHLVPSVLIPPHEHDRDAASRAIEGGPENREISVHELMERLEPYLE